MAYVTKRQRTAGESSYRVRWRDGDHQHERVFHRSEDAEAFRRQVEHDQVLGARTDPTRGKIRFGDYAETWLAER